MERLRSWFADGLPAYFLFGAVLGATLLMLAQQTQLLEDLYIMAHEQRRMWLAKAQRDLAAAAAKENPDDA